MLGSIALTAAARALVPIPLASHFMSSCAKNDLGAAENGQTVKRTELMGTNGGDTIHGSSGPDRMLGLDDNDLLTGHGGYDVFIGGKGADLLIGGQQDDNYIFSSGDGADIVKDDGGPQDSIVFDGNIDIDDLVVTEVAAGLLITIPKTYDSIQITTLGNVDGSIEIFRVGKHSYSKEKIEGKIVGNHRPRVVHPIPTQVAQVGVKFSFPIPDGSFVDPDGDRLKFDVKMRDNGHLPEWLHYHYMEFAVFGTPEPKDIGEFEGIITATDASFASASTVAKVLVRRGD